MSAPELELPAASELPNPFRDPIGVVERHWAAMYIALAAGVLASLTAWSLSERRYFAEATVVVAQEEVSERIAGSASGERAPAVTEALAAEVLSRRNLTELVTDFALYPGLKGVETMAEIVDRVRADVTLRAVQRLEPAAGASNESAYSIGFAAATPEAAAGVANRLASLFAETSSAERLRRQQLTTAFLRSQLAQAERDLRDQNQAIVAFKNQSRGLLPSDLEANLDRMELLQSQRQSLTLQIAEAGSRVATLESEDTGSPDAQLGLLRDELARLRTRHTSRHPDVIELERRIADLEQGRVVVGIRGGEEKSRRGLLQAAQQTLNVLHQQLAATEKELSELDAGFGKVPAVQEGLASLEERALFLRENYLEFQRKLQDAELGGSLLDAQQVRRVSVLNQAEPPSRPVSSRLRYLVLGFAASLGLALAVGFGLELLQPVVISPDDIVSIVGQPVLGWVTRIR